MAIRSFAAVVVGAALAVGGVGGVGQLPGLARAAAWSAAAPAAGSAGCPEVLFVGARGTSENGPGTPGWPKKHYSPGDPYGLGPELNGLREAMIKDIGVGVGVKVVSVRYDSSSIWTLLSNPDKYFANLQAGVDFTGKYLTQQAAACPHQQIVLAGYSQGAMIMHRIMHQLGTKMLYRVMAAVLVGDGDQVPSDRVTRFGSAPLTAVGIGLSHCTIALCTHAKFSLVTGNRVLSVCNTGDPVCATTPKDLNPGGVKVHLGYTGSRPLLAAAKLAAARVAASNFTGKGIDHPQGIAAGPDGALWFANDQNGSIGKISTLGAVSSYPGKGIDPAGIAAGPDGALWFTNPLASTIGRITTGGKISIIKDSSISAPFGITAGPDRAVWFTNWGTNSIGRISSFGVVTSYTAATIDSPFWITMGPDGALWFTNSGNNSIGRITTSGAVSNYTGPGIDDPQGITSGPDGALWFTNNANNSIGRITTRGVVTHYAGPGIDQPYGITAGPDGALWFASSGNNTIGRITTSGVVTGYRGPRIDGPYDIAPGPDGALWFTNGFNNSIGRVVGLTPIPPGGAWQHAIRVPGTAALGVDGQVTSISCASAGNCSAGGYYRDSKNNQEAFVVSEANGTWGTAREVPDIQTLNADGYAQVTSVSCAVAGDCAAAGFYIDHSGFYQGFVVDQSRGTWGNAQPVPKLGTLNQGEVAQVLSVSCGTPGNCAAAGYYKDSAEQPQAFVVDEVGGSWQDAIAVPGSVSANTGGQAQINSVSCAPDGSCVAGGYYTESGGAVIALLTTEQSGSWSGPLQIPNLPNLSTGGYAAVTSLSCLSGGNCGVGGVFTDTFGDQHPFVVDEIAGNWANAQEVPDSHSLFTSTNAQITSLSCAAAGDCSAGGWYGLVGLNQSGFVASEVNGVWDDAVQVPGMAALNVSDVAQVNSVSCASPGNCVAGGYYTDSDHFYRPFVSSEVNGTWDKALEIRGASGSEFNLDAGEQVNSVSCGAVANCSAGGFFKDDFDVDEPFVVSEP
jgi:virginiamycin B lyase